MESKIIKDLIAENEIQKQKMIKAYNAYRGKVPIKDRALPDNNKINKKLANDYRGDIIDTITGYLFGNPVTYQLDDESYTKGDSKKISDVLYDFNLMNAIDDLDSETGKIASICGYAARLLYIDKEGIEKIINIPPWEVIFINNGSTDEIDGALRYYEVEINENDKRVKRIKVEMYDKNNITFYLEDANGNFNLDYNEPKNPLPHMFKEVPIIKFKNNEEEQGDFEKVESLIDSYDLIMSDAQNEIEEFRQAYMIFYGCEPDEETVRLARQAGGFGVGEGQDIKFLTKQINDVFLENHKKTLNENIYKFSKTVDMSDENFSGGTQSGESRKWKLLGLENKAITKERKFSKGLRQMFKILSSSWNTKGIPVNYLDIYWEFKRNIPTEMTLEADLLQKLKGVISDKTRLGLVSFIDDPDWELEQMEKEREEFINLEGEDEDGNGNDGEVSNIKPLSDNTDG